MNVYRCFAAKQTCIAADEIIARVAVNFETFGALGIDVIIYEIREKSEASGNPVRRIIHSEVNLLAHLRFELVGADFVTVGAFMDAV